MSICGKMTITFEDHGQGAIVPTVSFDPVGRITPGLLERLQPLFIRETMKAQTAQRHAALHPPQEVADVP